MIDIAKFLCTILVVSIHVKPFGYSDSYLKSLLNFVVQNCFARIAVPVFFVTSGFLLYRKTSLENFSVKPTKEYIIKLIKLYAVWTLIYSPFRIKEIIASGKGVVYGILHYCAAIVITGSYTQLWYFPALIFSVVLISFLLNRKVSLRTIMIAALFFYMLGLLAQSWFGVIKPLKIIAPEIWSLLKLSQKVIRTTRDGLFEGFLFVGMGALIAFKGFRISQKKAFTGFMISFILMFIESFGVHHFGFAREYDMYIFLVPSTYFAFALIVNHHISKESTIYKTLRVLSSLIFYTHLWINWLISKLFALTGYEIGKTCLLFILTVIVSTVFSYVIYILSRDSRFKYLRILYS